VTHIPLQAPLCQAIDYMVRQADVFHESSPQAAGARVVEKRRLGFSLGELRGPPSSSHKASRNDVDAHRRLLSWGRAQRGICAWNHRSGASNGISGN